MGRPAHTLELVTRIGTRIMRGIMIQWGNTCKTNSKYMCMELLSNTAKKWVGDIIQSTAETQLWERHLPKRDRFFYLLYLSLALAFPLLILTLLFSHQHLQQNSCLPAPSLTSQPWLILPKVSQMTIPVKSSYPTPLPRGDLGGRLFRVSEYMSMQMGIQKSRNFILLLSGLSQYIETLLD